MLKDVGFSVKRGEYLGIIGPNGGGKTTLLRIMLGLLKPESGVIRLFGQEIGKLTDRHRIGYVPQRIEQAGGVCPASVKEIVSSGRTPGLGFLRSLGPQDRQAVESAMEAAGVAGLSGRLVGELSGGERQRVYIARALAAEPELLVLDEPAVGVDVAAQEAFYDFLGSLNRERGLTVVFVSHDVGVVAREVSTMLCLNTRMFCHGSPDNFIKEDFLKELYGSRVRSVLHRH